MRYGAKSVTAEDLVRLRKGTTKNQDQLAAEALIETSRLSQILDGQLAASEDETGRLLGAIGTPQAAEYRAFKRTSWRHLPKPSFWNPDRKVLDLAQRTLADLRGLTGSLIGSPLAAQVDLYKKTVDDAAAYLADLSHDVVPIGPIGVGKTTATAALTGLMLPDASGDLDDRVVLETGQGRTTICEVVISQGAEYAVRVEPYAEGEVRQLVRDFCGALFGEASEGSSGDREEGVGEEIERALRNMAGLTRRTEKGHKGRIDTAVEALGGMATVEERCAAFFTRMDNARRTRFHLRHDTAEKADPLPWLRDVFQKINHGLLSDVPLPRRIEVQIPDPVLGDEELNLRWADTKGIDKTAVRPDLQRRLEDPRSLLVLCSGFADAPGSEAQSLIEHAAESGLRGAIAERTVFLALPHDGVARKMRNPDTLEKVSTDEEGYDEKARQVRDAAICRRYALEVPVLFLNAASADDCGRVRGQLHAEVRRMRRHHGEQIEQVGEAVRQLLADLDRARTEAAQREVNRQLQIFLSQNEALPRRAAPAYQHLIDLTKGSNASSVKAAVRRRGDWHNFDAYLHLATGAAQEAQSRSDHFFQHLEGLLSQMVKDDRLEPIRPFLERLGKSAESWRERFVSEIRNEGSELFRAALERAEVWHACSLDEGKGYLLRIAWRLKEWFEGPPTTPDLLDALEKLVQAEWNLQVLDEFRRLCAEVAADAPARTDGRRQPV